jgi:hypothetical protein
MEIGTSIRLSSRRRAVTTMSPVSSAPAAGACAKAGVAAKAHASATRGKQCCAKPNAHDHSPDACPATRLAFVMPIQ